MFDESSSNCAWDDALFSSCPIYFADLFAGALAPLGVQEKLEEQSTENVRCLTDGEAVVGFQGGCRPSAEVHPGQQHAISGRNHSGRGEGV